MEPLADSIGLRAISLSLGMIDVLNRQIYLILVVSQRPAILGASVS